MPWLVFVTFINLDHAYASSTGKCSGMKPVDGYKETFFPDRLCRNRCDISTTCTGYTLHERDNWCELHNLIDAQGDRNSNIKCYVKGKR